MGRIGLLLARAQSAKGGEEASSSWALSRETMPRSCDLPGVGEYTAAAVASIAFGLPHAVLDGNVARVLSRLTAEPGDIQSDAVRKRLRSRRR